jgi:hypothetical protein
MRGDKQDNMVESPDFDDPILGIPVFSGDDLVGMIGIANRPGGYDDDVVDYLRPMTATFANFIVGLRAERERQAIENQLAESATLVTTLTNALPAAILFEDTKRNLIEDATEDISLFNAESAQGRACGHHPARWPQGASVHHLSELQGGARLQQRHLLCAGDLRAVEALHGRTCLRKAMAAR